MSGLKADNVLRLQDGRLLGYGEYGDPDGRPLFFFHGTPGSRVQARGIAEAAAAGHARIIAPDRPGFGLSDFKPNRTLLDWADDVAELADALGLEQFGVVGLSGGGPSVIACALKLPERLTAAGIVSGVGPFDVADATVGMSRSSRLGFALGQRAPLALRPLLALITLTLRRSPDRVLAAVFAEAPEADKAIWRRPEIRDLFRDDLLEAARQGARGAAYEAALYARPWGVKLEEITIPVYLWQGEDDVNVPPSMGRAQAEAIPDCRATFISGAGHLWGLDHFEEILAALFDEPGDTAAVTIPGHLKTEEGAT